MTRGKVIFFLSLFLGIFFLLMTLALPFLFLIFFFLAAAYFVQSLEAYHKRKGNIPPAVKKLKTAFMLFWVAVNLTSTLFLWSFFPLQIIILWGMFFLLVILKTVPPTFLLSIIPVFFFAMLIVNNAIDNTDAPYKARFTGVAVQTRGARSIFTDAGEENIYFIVQLPEARQHNQTYYTLFRYSLKNSAEPDVLEYYFCPSGVYDKKRKNLKLISRVTDELLTVEPEHLRIIKKQKIRRDPDDILLDEKNDSILVLYEEGGLGAYDPVTLSERQFKRWPCCVSAKAILSKKQKKIFIASLFTPVTLTTTGSEHLEQLQRKILGLSSWGIALDEHEENLYITDFFLGRLSKLDANTLQVTQSAWIKSGIRPVAVDEGRKLIYIGNYLDPYLIILDGNFKKIAKVFVGKTCRDIKLLKNGRLFAATRIGLVEVYVDKLLKDVRKHE